MIDQWDNPEFASNWDQTSHVGNPTRREMTDILLTVVGSLYRKGDTILDLGSGSGLIEEQLLQVLPEAHVIGIESSAPMIEMAQARLAPFGERYKSIQHDLGNIGSLQLPAGKYPIVISVQALHHMKVQQQRSLYSFIVDLLPTGGTFLLMDRIALEVERFKDLYSPAWERLERLAEHKSGWSGEQYLQRQGQKGDYPFTLDEHLAALRGAGLQATCLYLNLDRALFAAIKV